MISNKQHSKTMLANKSQDTSIEISLRKALWHKGIRYRKNHKICNCRVDIAITKHKIAIFCDGDFWHGHTGYANFNFKSNVDFWNKKINRNKERDLENTIALRDAGWTVLRFWESDIRNSIDVCLNEVQKYIN